MSVLQEQLASSNSLTLADVAALTDRELAGQKDWNRLTGRNSPAVWNAYVKRMSPEVYQAYQARLDAIASPNPKGFRAFLGVLGYLATGQFYKAVTYNSGE